MNQYIFFFSRFKIKEPPEKYKGQDQDFIEILTSYQDLAAAQGEIASLGISDSGIKAITKASMEFSYQFAGTTAPEFVKASYYYVFVISVLFDLDLLCLVTY